MIEILAVETLQKALCHTCETTVDLLKLCCTILAPAR